LNLIRAGCAATPETSEHTSAKLRIEGRAEWLAPLELDERQSPGAAASESVRRASDKGYLPLTPGSTCRSVSAGSSIAWPAARPPSHASLPVAPRAPSAPPAPGCLPLPKFGDDNR